MRAPRGSEIVRQEMMRRVLLAPRLVLLLEGWAVAATSDWGDYTNVRFQYTICYPRGLLIPQGESDNGDGQRFEGRDDATLAVWGRYEVLGQTLDQIEADTVKQLAGKSGTVTYSRRGPTWFVVSGVTNDKMFYAKTFLVGDTEKSFEISYPREKAQIYNAVTARVASCFKSLGTER
jgi:hypothetical protein